MRSIAKLCIAAFVFSVVPALVVTDAGAADNVVYRFTYPIIPPVGQEASAGPGGARSIRGFAGLAFTGGPGPEATVLNVNVLEQPPACGPGIPSTLAGEWQVDWATDCVNPTDFCVLRFTTPKGPVTIQRAYWANALGDSIAPAIVEQLNAPASDDWSLMALMSALAFTGAGFVLRRRSVVASG